MNLIQKLKTGIAGLGLIGASYFSVNAQEKYIPEYNTTTHYILKEVQKENAFISPKTLDDLINKSKIIVRENYNKNPYDTENAKELMKKINSEIIEKYLKLDENEKEKRSCFYKTLVYLAIAEENNLPLYAAPLSTHMFIRWDPNGKHKLNQSDTLNRGDFNWDPNFLEFNSDYAYMFFDPENFKLTGAQFYLYNLEKKKLISQAYTEEAKTLTQNKEYKKALLFLDKAIELDERNFGGYEVKGAVHALISLESEEPDTTNLRFAAKNFEKFISLWGSDEKTFFSLSENYRLLQEYEKSEEYINKALEIKKEKIDYYSKDNVLTLYKEKSDYADYLTARFKIYKMWGKYEEAKRDSSEILGIQRNVLMGLHPSLRLTDVYPEGVNEEILKEGSKTIITKIVIKDNKSEVYKKIIHPWNTFYTKNDNFISESSWLAETKE